MRLSLATPFVQLEAVLSGHTARSLTATPRGEHRRVTFGTYLQFLDDLDILFAWDGGDEVAAHKGPWTNICANLDVSWLRRTWGPVVHP